MSGRSFFAHCAAAALAVCVFIAAARAEPIRIVTYNIQADTGGYTTVRPGFFTVIQGIGDDDTGGTAQPIDILALQETTSNSTTVAPIVTQMNTMYGAGTYAMSPYQGTQNGSASSGNGPNAMVYHTTTLQLIASVGVGTPSSSGFPRQPVRYQFRPIGGDSSLEFYVYVSHAKAGTTTTDKNRRNIEAQAIRANEATLPAAARVFYVGDWNLTGSSEPAYQTLLAAGQGQGFDPPDRPGNWETNPLFVDVMTYSPSNLRYRDDFELVTQNIMSDPNGITYIAGSFRPFANNGSVPLYGSLNSGDNTAVPDLPNRAAVLSALTTASDHIPVVADFDIPLGAAPEITGQPSDQTVCAGGSASFTVTASGSPAPTYQWRKGTTNLVDGGNISGATTATLTLDPVGTGDAATNYNCVVTNSNGSATSDAATLTVDSAPTITGSPVDTATHTGQEVTFTVTASGTGTLTYQWRKDGGDIGGATGSAYTISSAALADAGSYDCVVANDCGAATSDEANLTVWLTGDLNCDGVLDNFDINPFVLALTDPAAYAASYPDCYVMNADCNGDGALDNFDINPFVSLLVGP